MLNKPIKINELLCDFLPVDAVEKYAQCISGLTLDSRAAKRGDLFFALKGHKVDGVKYIADAVEKGVAAVLCESESDVTSSNVPIIHVVDLRKLIGLIAAKFYGYPARAMTMIGVTGTNGKTSCTHFIAKLLQDLGCPCAVIGTVGAGFLGDLSPLSNTTPDAITLQQSLARFREQGARAIAMEVSSHALIQDRIQGIDFKIAVFTNLTHEHLDYHGNMEDYAAAKKILFMQPSIECAVINLGDKYGQELLKSLVVIKDQLLNPALKIYGYGIEIKTTLSSQIMEQQQAGVLQQPVPQQQPVLATDKTAVVSTLSLAFPMQNFIYASNVTVNTKGIKADIKTPWNSGVLKSCLLGKFNLSNLLAVITVLGSMEFAIDDVLAKIALLQPVSGRMQAFGGDSGRPLVVIDYAHTPDALEQALQALREHCQGSLWCVFGCGGDRDRSKRPLMGQIAERYSDNIIITSDNPRSENPQQIVDDIVAGLLCPWAVEIEHDRRAAIAHALDCAKAGDIVLIAGKGHENYQIIGKEKTLFSDAEVVKTILATLVPSHL